jgi:DNA-binding GntR family transcriptional regulator
MDPNSIEAALREDIEQGLLRPGTVLKQEQLAARYAVSRQPVRQAMERLLAMGLLERRSDRSLAVTGMSEREAAELLGLRIAVETSALRLSLEKLDEAALRRARHAADEIFHSEDVREIEELDVAFHRLIYSRCGNNRMMALIDELRREGRRAYAEQMGDAARRATLHAEHQAILSACVEKDAESAIRLLAAHLRGASALTKADQP